MIDPTRLGKVLAVHTPWAQAIFGTMTLWVACYCGWNANRGETGSWNDHLLSVIAAETTSTDDPYMAEARRKMAAERHRAEMHSDDSEYDGE